MSGEHVDPIERRRVAREKFIQERTMEEQKANAWIKSLSELDESIRSQIPFEYTGISYQTECPELYKEIPNREQAYIQIAALQEKILIVNKLVSDYNAESDAILKGSTLL